MLIYTISNEIIEKIHKAEKIRKEILLTPIQPKVERKLRWEATLQKIFWGLSLADTPLSKENMLKILSSPPKKKMNNFEKDVLNYKKALDYIKEEWLASPQIVKADVLLKLYDISCKPTFGSSKKSFKEKKGKIEYLLNYLHTGNEHPIIQAGVAQIEIIKIAPFDYANRRVARLFTYLMLYKNGFDCKDLLVIEEYYRKDIVALKEALRSAFIQENLNTWLDYFTNGIVVQLEKALEKIKEEKISIILPSSLWKLNPIQKRILEILENPEKKITNKEVQKIFGISQITASRYLSKMLRAGFLLSHGRGRSVFYTKA